MVLVIDPQVSGIAGDMVLSSLVHMGADQDRVADSIRRSAESCAGLSVQEIRFEDVDKHGIMSTALAMEIQGDAPFRKGSDVRSDVIRSVAGLGLSSEAESFAAACIDSLISAESKIHGGGDVHLHESAGFDTVADIVGTAVALDDLGIFGERIICLPVAVGDGLVTFSHGTMSNPASAILEIFCGSGLAICGGPAGAELTTPTGACILSALGCDAAGFYPTMRIDSVGYGAGHRNLEFPNVLKMVRGKEGSGSNDSVTLLETNVDDVSGEVLGGLIEKAMAKGALDASIYPGITKKGRPASLISVMCRHQDAAGLADLVMAETGTLGMRISRSDRITAPRETAARSVSVGGRMFEVRLKSSVLGERRSVKIEFDDLKEISQEIGVPIREAELLVRREIESLDRS